MLPYIWLLFIGITLVVSLKKSSYGCCCLLVSRILIPECVRLTPFTDMSLNTGVIGVVSICLFKELVLNYRNRVAFFHDGYFKFLTFVCLLFFVSLFVSNYADLSEQQSILIQFFITDIVPAFLFVGALKTKEDVKIVVDTLLVVSIVTCVYSIFTFFIKSNPYVFLMKLLYSENFDVAVKSADLILRGDMMGTSSTFLSTNGFGYFLPITFVIFVFLYKSFKKKIYLFTCLLLSISVVLCAKRSAWVAYISFYFLCYFFSNYKEKRVMLKWICMGSVIMLLIIFIPQLESVRKFMESSLFFWDDDLMAENDISGSTWELRVRQVFYPWVEVGDNLLFGNGFGWCSNYLKNNDIHPLLYGFETIFSTAVLEGGILGCIIWIQLFIRSYRYSRKNDRNKTFYLIFTLTQVVIAVATGFSYFIFYGIYIVLLNRIYLLKALDSNCCVFEANNNVVNIQKLGAFDGA